MQKRNPSENIIKVQKENQEKLIVVIMTFKILKRKGRMIKKECSVLIDLIEHKFKHWKEKNQTRTKS